MRIVVLFLLIISNVLYANSAEYKAEVFKAITELKNNPTEYLNKYTDSPDEMNINNNNIEDLARQKAVHDKDVILIRNSFNNRPEYKLSAEELSKPTKIIENSDDIVDGISNSYTDCKKIRNCTIKYDNAPKYCKSSSKPQGLSCDKDRVVSVTYPNMVKSKIRVEMSAYNDEASYTFDLKNKKLISGTTVLSHYLQDGDYTGITCSNFTYRVLATGLLLGTWTKRVNWRITFNGDCKNPVVEFYFDQTKSGKYGYQTKGGFIEIELISQDPPEVHDSFESTCTEVNKWTDNGYCREIKTKCLDGESTKPINGVKITRDCWRYRSTYSCGVPEGQAIDTCKELELQHCMQISSTCTNYLGDKCVEQENGFKCPTNYCSTNSNIVCGGTNIECRDGSCVQAVEKEPSDFNDAITKFSVIGEALKGAPKLYDENTRFMFSGRAMECRKVGYGFSDCCKDNGWGNDIGLAHCSDDEKDLGEKKEQHFTVYLGEKSHTNDIGIKLTDKVYCVFDSKLARIIQQHGRSGQLGISMGDAKNPNCSAISPNDLARIDFDKIDLSEAFLDATSKHKNINLDETKSNLTSKINNYYTEEVDENA